MATKIKEEKLNEKGIIIFTHKELKLFRVSNPLKRLFWRLIKNHYFIGVHYGSHHENVVPSSLIDFHMAGKSTLSFAKDIPFTPERTNLCSRNFLGLIPETSEISKKWDVLNISRPIDCKHLRE